MFEDERNSRLFVVRSGDSRNRGDQQVLLLLQVGVGFVNERSGGVRRWGEVVGRIGNAGDESEFLPRIPAPVIPFRRLPAAVFPKGDLFAGHHVERCGVCVRIAVSPHPERRGKVVGFGLRAAGRGMRCCAESVGRRYVEMERPVAARQFRREAAVFLREDAARARGGSQPLRTVTAKPIEPSPGAEADSGASFVQDPAKAPAANSMAMRSPVRVILFISFVFNSRFCRSGHARVRRRSQPGACLRPGGGVNPARPIRASAWGGRFGTAFGRGYSSGVWSVGIQSSTVTVNQI